MGLAKLNAMTITDLQIQLDIHFDSKTNILRNVSSKVDEGFFFVDSKDGHCYLFDKSGNLDDVAKVKTLKERYIKKDIKKIVIPDSMTSIGDYAFYYCSNLTNVTISNSVTRIGDVAFCKCSGLTSVTIPNSITSIGEGAFFDCSGLKSIMIPDSVMCIKDRAFFGCSSLADVNGFVIVRNVLYFYHDVGGIVVIPNNVTNIGPAAFYECNNLTNVMIPNSVNVIGYSAFYSCSSLKSMTIPNSVTRIGHGAFYYCNNLKSLIFKDKTLEQVKAMKNYPWGIKDKSIIRCKS